MVIIGQLYSLSMMIMGSEFVLFEANTLCICRKHVEGIEYRKSCRKEKAEERRNKFEILPLCIKDGVNVINEDLDVLRDGKRLQ